MNSVENYPVAPVLGALRTVAGRIGLVFVSALLGIMLGGVTATHELGGAWTAITSFPAWATGSFFVSVGIVALPAAFLFGLLFIRSGWPLWMVAGVALLMWWNAHQTIHWAIYESAGAKMQKQMDAMMGDMGKRPQEPHKSP